ncbi:DUF4153 domain-containing protein [Pseudomonas sp. MAFF212428]|uniref:DUF4153 domain-containing protein n=1 Tax=Pseudomonas brassicae TaxID=2708063 RepID=A0A6B3P2K2_9PSED|nr:DUF4153 domain-containing protein [Pseudomonas brassicae]NER61478.1 DUF4153 domain-containing protein [Pseudomonas brassicae]NER66588.1 DUF4153 domain-containing protein [Pseudomonas brassicae]
MPALNRSMLYYLAIALVQGPLLISGYVLHQPVLGVFAGVLALVGGLNLQLLGSTVRRRGTLWLVSGLALLMAGMSAWAYVQAGTDWVLIHWCLASVVLTYIGTAFVLSWPTGEGVRLRYADLFQHAWNTAFIVLLAWLVTLAFWLLLWLCGRLFTMLGAPQVSERVSDPFFIALGLPFFFSLGIRMGRDNAKVIGLLRNVLLTVCRYLLPLCALIVVVFTLALAVSGVEPIFSTGHSTGILLCLVGFTLFLVNGVLQDGEHNAGYANPLKLLVNVSLACLPLLVALAGYASGLRIEQYGLTPDRFLAMLLIGIALVHSLAALWAVLARQAVWLGSLRRSNPMIALLSFVLLMLVFTPVLNPLAYSAANQVERLLSGRTPVDQFDMHTLRHQFGAAGVQQFEALSKSLEQGQILDARGREQLARLIVKTDPVDRSRDAYGPKLEWVGPAPEDSAQLLEVSLTRTQCGSEGCVAWQVDMDDDGVNEVLLVPKHAYTHAAFLYVRDNGVWRDESRLDGLKGSDVLIEQIRQGTLKPVRPRYLTLEIDGVEASVSRNR